MKKLMFAVVMGLAALSAQATQYISQCALAWANDGQSPSSDAKLANAGYTVVADHFNAGDACSSSPRIKMGAKYTTDPDQAITGFAIYNGEHAPDSYSRGGITYYKIGSGVVDWCPAACDGAVDLNRSAGGDYLYLYATRDIHAGPPVTDVRLSCKENAADARAELVNNGFTPVYDQVGAEPPADCNSQCKGANKLFLGYKFSDSASYRYPVYNTAGDPASGIKSWETGSVVAMPVRTAQTTWSAGWYVVVRDMTIESYVACNGHVHLILADGVKLTLTRGLRVPGDGSALTIYGQAGGTGSLTAISASWGAGIGGGGTTQFATSHITINGGVVTALGGEDGAGIGGNQSQSASDITVNGGVVTAIGGENAAGIGGGICCNGSNITINGGKVTATGGKGAMALGGGKGGTATNIRINRAALTVLADVDTLPATVIANDGGDLAAKLASRRFLAAFPSTEIPCHRPVYRDGGVKKGIAYWETLAVTCESVTSDRTTWGASGQTSWYAVDGADVTVASRITCAGSVNLILKDGCKLTAEEGIAVTGDGNALTIYGQGHGTGTLTALSTKDGTAGIGGELGAGSHITINGGVVNATGGADGAGIGGGKCGGGSDIVLNGGKVTATGGTCSAGIGGGYRGNACDITVNGGEVTASGGENAAGIGAGVEATASNIIIDTLLLTRADTKSPAIAVVRNGGGNLAGELANKRYAKIEQGVPSWLDAENMTKVGKYRTWAAKFGVTHAPTARKAAFLLNCADGGDAVEEAKKAFRLDIAVNPDGTVTVTHPEGYNGTVKLWGKTSLTDADWHVKAEGHRFFRATLEL